MNGGQPHPTLVAPEPQPWRRRFKRTLVTGLVILVPVAITIYVLVLLFGFMDGIFAPVVNRAVCLPIKGSGECADFHIPGLGLMMTFLVVMVVGWLSSNVGGRRGIVFIEGLIGRIPVAKSIYGATKGVLEAVSRDQTEAFKRVVLVEYPKAKIYVLAFVTGNARWPSLHAQTGDLLLTFVPTTPNPTSGFLLLVPREEAIEVPISVEEGIRMVISGGILLPDVERALAASGVRVGAAVAAGETPALAEPEEPVPATPGEPVPS